MVLYWPSAYYVSDVVYEWPYEPKNLKGKHYQKTPNVNYQRILYCEEDDRW